MDQTRTTAPQRPVNLTEATSPRSFKCSRCGNMFAIGDRNDAVCDVCGNRCTTNSCLVLYASDEGY